MQHREERSQHGMGDNITLKKQLYLLQSIYEKKMWESKLWGAFRYCIEFFPWRTKEVSSILSKGSTYIIKEQQKASSTNFSASLL